MQYREMDLVVGDTVCVGECMLTVIDISGDEISFRIDEPVNEHDAVLFAQSGALPGK